MQRKAMVEYYFYSTPRFGVPFAVPELSMPRAWRPYTQKLEPVYQPAFDAGNQVVNEGKEVYIGAMGMAQDGAGMGAGMVPDEVNQVLKRRNPYYALVALREITLFRAVKSPHQLYERMVEFWGNHFSIHAAGSPELYVHKLLDDREVIRPNAMGSFRSLLEASAKSTAMLYYLDGVSNMAGAPNENYARELMELHTIGTGKFSEDDVLAVARCFTGWTIDPVTADFTFDDASHDKAEKKVLGHTIEAGGGIEDGLKVLDILVNHEATAQLIATKLVRRFVSDHPPESLVQEVAAAFGTDGDVKAMLTAILYSDAFRNTRDEKVKRPLDVAVSALRATEATVAVRKMGTLVHSLSSMGQIPYNWAPPNGYPDVSNYWLSTNGLMQRWLYGVFIGKGGVKDLSVNFNELLDGVTTPRELVERLRAIVLKRPLLEDDRNNLIAYAAENDGPDDTLHFGVIKARAKGVLTLMLNSAYFQLG